MTGPREWVARFAGLRGPAIPDAPSLSIRDPWPGDPGRGARLLKGDIDYLGAARRLVPGSFADMHASASLLDHVHGFSWLRDLRALGTDAARGRARALITSWIECGALPDRAGKPAVVGARLASWLGHYDFFAASADDVFRQSMMARLVSDARLLSAAIPPEARDGSALTALKGLIAASVAMPDHAAFLARALRFLPPEIERQVLADGGHIERSPAAQLQALQDLTEIRSLLQIGRAEVPASLPGAIERMAGALRALRHGDGGLALFNGAREDWATLIDLVLSQAGRTGRSSHTLPVSGFQRLVAGKSVVIVDAGVPAPPGADRLAHAGTLSFEFSVGRDRVVVNCGAAPASAGEWRDVLRTTAAHSTLVIADVASSELTPTGLGRRPGQVEAQRHEANGAHWLELSHDGWRVPFGAVHRRRLYLAESGDDLRGEDVIEADQGQPYTLRFHLHPSVTVSLQQDSGSALLRLPSGQGWRFRADGAALSIEESIYFGGAEPRRAEQLVLTGGEDDAQQVKWALTKVG